MSVVSRRRRRVARRHWKECSGWPRFILSQDTYGVPATDSPPEAWLEAKRQPLHPWSRLMRMQRAMGIPYGLPETIGG